MKRALGLWIVGWLVIGVADLALGFANSAPAGILALAALTAFGFIAVGSVVISFLFGSSLAIDRAPDRTVQGVIVVFLVVGGGAAILLPGVAIVLCVALGLVAAGLGIRLVPVVMSGRQRGRRPDDEALRRNARRDEVLARVRSKVCRLPMGSASIPDRSGKYRMRMRPDKRINLTRPTASVVTSSRSPRGSCAVR